MNIAIPNRFTQFTLLSLAFHLVFGLIITLFINYSPLTFKDKKPQKSFKVEKVSPELLEKLRTVGKKSGKKNIFTSPLKIPQGSGGKKNKKLSFKSLGATKNAPLPKQISKEVSAPEKIKKNLFQKLNNKQSQTYRLARQQQTLQKEVIKKISASKSASDIIQNRGFNVQFETPEGVSEDELNTIEKMLYGFQKRMFETYVNAYMIAYNKQVTSRPYLKSSMADNKHLLKGRVIFDKEGNIISIKIFKSTPSDEVHSLFEETLKGMKALPNPPQVMTKNKEQFTIYYTLQIN